MSDVEAPTLTCGGCGAEADPSGPRPSACGHCPPETCAVCGGINHIATDRLCACWVSVQDMNVADLKAMFSRDGTFSINPVI